MGMLLPCLVGQRLLRVVANRPFRPDREAEAFVRERYEELIERDLANVEAGDYPKSLLFQLPFKDYLSQAPHLLLDMPRTLRRMWQGRYRDLPVDVDVRRYPAYFRRNFHWQTDGYFSRRSAEMYDVGVEFLFLGTADVMRRQIIPPVSRLVRERGDDLRLLDVACGTGRTLRQLATAHPKLRYYGLDLSPYYLQFAAKLLSSVEHLSLVNENAESMPFTPETFDIVTSVHLFHELPRAARRNVYREMMRVLRPGGLLVIEDSAQRIEAGPLGLFLGKFAEEFHEPFYREYLGDDIGEALREVGFEDVRTELHFVSKVVVARKPAR
jgi:ubiquinone/menaquinone biosynthesis C-methylase UbiE